MHKLMIIAVEADSPEDAQESAEQHLEQYQQREFDWYELGGRWHKFIGSDIIYDPDTNEPIEYVGTNILCYAENPELFNSTINDAITERLLKALSELRALRGEPLQELPADNILPDEAEETFVKETLKRLNAENMKHHKVLKELFTVDTLEDLHERLYSTEKVALATPLFRVQRLLGLLEIFFNGNQLFFDAVGQSSGREYVDMRKASDPDKQFILAYDLHT
tara:strand:+ start:2122 stop:2787 length:666 start_codon:yes stop_codon:yes gene_type:complete